MRKLTQAPARFCVKFRTLLLAAPTGGAMLNGRLRHLMVIAALAIAVYCMVIAGVVLFLRDQMSIIMRDAADRGAQSNASLLSSEMDKFRLLPALLVEFPLVSDALENRTAQNVLRLNQLVTTFAERTSASDIYVMDQGGRTLAASNWQSANSFVGHNYAFRPYFKEAMLNGKSSYFALGTVSRRPGLYLAQQIIDQHGTAIGVLAVKIEFGQIEDSWALREGTTLVMDQAGVILISSNPDWRLHSLEPISPEMRQQISADLRFPDVPVTQLPMVQLADDRFRFEQAGSEIHYHSAVRALPDEKGWTLFYLLPERPYAEGFWRQLLVILSVSLLLGVVVTAFVWRFYEKRHIRQSYLAELEDAVASRTQQLKAANSTLIAESEARETAVREFHQAREALAQSNRLSILGTITGEVAHEINQPIAAIHAYAENCQQLVKLERMDQVCSTLSKIIDLTTRMSKISTRLRNFSARRPERPRVLTLQELLDGAMLIIGEGVRQSGARLEISLGECAQVRVLAIRHQIEQVFVNLVQNSIESFTQTGPKTVNISASLEADNVVIVFSDDGPGIAPELRDTLFEPFITSKERGVGLGLAISRDILNSHGGAIRLRRGSANGSTFEILLTVAE